MYHTIYTIPVLSQNPSISQYSFCIAWSSMMYSLRLCCGIQEDKSLGLLAREGGGGISFFTCSCCCCTEEEGGGREGCWAGERGYPSGETTELPIEWIGEATQHTTLEQTNYKLWEQVKLKSRPKSSWCLIEVKIEINLGPTENI